MVKALSSNAGGVGSIPGQGTKIPVATGCGQKLKKKKKKELNRLFPAQDPPQHEVLQNSHVPELKFKARLALACLSFSTAVCFTPKKQELLPDQMTWACHLLCFHSCICHSDRLT